WLSAGLLPGRCASLPPCAGGFGRRVVLFSSAAPALALLCAVGWSPPVFKIIYELVPGVELFRPPADATFLAGGLGAILAGYAAHRLFSSPPFGVPRRTVALLAPLLAGSCLVAVLLPVWLHPLPRLPPPPPPAAAALAA